MADRYPYSQTALERLHPDGWFDVPPRIMLPSDLVPTQADVSIERVLHHLAEGEAEAGDWCIHVVAHDGCFYVHDGHHRWLAARVLESAGARLRARVVDEEGRHVI